MKFLCLLEWVLKHSSRVLWRAATFVTYFRIGKEYGIPTCCVAHFSWNLADPKFRRAKRTPAERGVIYFGTDKAYIPCGYHSGRHPEWTPNDTPANVTIHYSSPS